MPRFTFASVLKIIGWLVLAVLAILATRCFPTFFLPE